jgi:hypothetical protein
VSELLDLSGSANIPQAIRKVAHPSSVHYPRLVDRLFHAEVILDETESKAIDLTYDAGSTSSNDIIAWLRVVKGKLVELFRRHGAIELNTSLLIPVTPLLVGDQSKAARFLDTKGKLVSGSLSAKSDLMSFDYRRYNFPTTDCSRSLDMPVIPG